MRRIILTSHGSLAEGMYSAEKAILGDSGSISAFGLDRYETPEALLKAVRIKIAQSPSDEIFVLCDIKNGSIHNELIQLLADPGDIRILTGMNLGMVLELCVSVLDMKKPENLNSILEAGKNGILCYDKTVIPSIRNRKESDSLW